MEWGLSAQSTKCRHCRYPATKGRCRGNRFRDYIACKWPLTGDMGISYERWLVFTQPLRLWLLSLVS